MGLPRRWWSTGKPSNEQANLPLGGLGIAGKIGGEFSSGTTLDIALAMVGKRRTTWNDVSKDDLVGRCDGATHYVRAILVGAFAMKTGSKAKAAAAAEIFGAGASGESSSAKDVATSDGKLESCEQATGDENKPPSQCGAILRLELEPIAKSAHAAAANEEQTKQDPQPKAEVVAGCPPGLMFSNGACKSSRTTAPHACSPGDLADCRAQCDKGDAVSSCYAPRRSGEVKKPDREAILNRRRLFIASALAGVAAIRCENPFRPCLEIAPVTDAPVGPTVCLSPVPFDAGAASVDAGDATMADGARPRPSRKI